MNQVWSKCKITGKTFTNGRGFLNHLRALKIKSRDYYDQYRKSEDEGLCYCGKETKYYGFRYSKYCSDSCACKSPEHREAVSKRFINNPAALENFRKLSVNKWPNPDKAKRTFEANCLRDGVDPYERRSQLARDGAAKITDEQRHINAVTRQNTMLKNGTKCGRSGYKPHKLFDEIVALQGYEPIVATYLEECGKLVAQDIIAGKGDVPHIRYDYEGKLRTYFPDFYLPNHNLLIEVKSTYTYEKNEEQTNAKCAACLASGYSILLLVLKGNTLRKQGLEGSKNLLDWAISSQASNPKQIVWYDEGSTTIPSGSRKEVKLSEMQLIQE